MREVAERLGVAKSTAQGYLQAPAGEVEPIANIQTADGRPVAGAGEGNTRAVTHGLHSARVVAPRAAAIREELVELVPVGGEPDMPAITLLAHQLARCELANEWLDEVGLLDAEGKPQPILRMLSTWENSAARLCDQLGLTPTARARLGLDLSRMEPSIVKRMQEGGQR